MLYSRDFTKLTDQEREEWVKADAALDKASKNGMTPSSALVKYGKDLPLAALHFQQLFPNNYLRIGDSGKSEMIRKKAAFEQLLNSGAGERQVLNFLKDEEAAFIAASILKTQGYGFGHHLAFAFREFELPPNYKVDFLLVGKGSGGFEFIFVEFESPIGSITTADGDFGEVIRKGLKQVDDWENWIDAHYSGLLPVYDRLLGEHDKQIPREFFELDRSRIHFAVVAGRRKNFSIKIYQKKRKLFKAKGILLLHYDNLLDNTDLLIQHGNY